MKKTIIKGEMGGLPNLKTINGYTNGLVFKQNLERGKGLMVKEKIKVNVVVVSKKGFAFNRRIFLLFHYF